MAKEIMRFAADGDLRESEFHQAGTLKLKNILWREALIYFPPCKGGKPLTFPLYPNVAEALLDYIKTGEAAVLYGRYSNQGRH